MLATVTSKLVARHDVGLSRRACLAKIGVGIGIAIATISMGACRLKADSEAPQAQAPTFTLADQDGKATSLQELTRSGHAVLVFYRGHW